MEGLRPDREWELGSLHSTVRSDAELRPALPTSVRHRPAIKWLGDIVRVAIGTPDAIRPSLGDQPRLGYTFVVEAPQIVKQCLRLNVLRIALSTGRAGMLSIGVDKR